MRQRTLFPIALFALLAFSLHGSEPELRIVSYGPTGEVASLGEANEVRLVFSEPMVALGRIPDPVEAPFFRIEPRVEGTFRWSGTTILIFTPDPARPLPFATSYSVTVDASATSVAGRTLREPLTFSFTTPTVRLLSTNWYRRNGRFDDPLVILMRFNQPVRPPDVAAHLMLSLDPHPWDAPTLTPRSRTWMETADPDALAAFDRKVEETRQVTQAKGPVINFLTDEWNKERFPPGDDLVVIETQPGVRPDSWVKLTIDGDVPSPQGAVVPGLVQTYVIRLEPTLFVEGFQCVDACEPANWNAIRFRSMVHRKNASGAMKVLDVTKDGEGKPIAGGRASKREEWWYSDYTNWISIEEAGFGAQPPASTYRVEIGPELESQDGQTLGFRWVGFVENWHDCAFISFGDGHGVWESDGGPILPFYARNLKSVNQWAAPVSRESLVPTMIELQETGYFRKAPPVEPVERKLGVKLDTILSHGLDMSKALDGRAWGLVWTAAQQGDLVADCRSCYGTETRASLVQVTNLAINVKDSPVNTLIFVTTLDTGTPVAGAKVSIVTRDNATFWSGTTGADGVAIAPNTVLRDPDWYWRLQFVVTAEKDGDFAYIGSDWNEGIDAWEFDLPYEVEGQKPILRGRVFTDRGVYKPGEEVQFKAVVRTDTPSGIRLLPDKTQMKLTITDSRGNEVDSRSVPLGAWSSAEWTLALPKGAALGNWSVSAEVEGQNGTLYGGFLVAAYRRPEFRVDVGLSGTTAVAGETLSGKIDSRYLFGAPMAGRPVRWVYTRDPFWGVPAAVRNRYPEDRWTFLGYWQYREPTSLESQDAALDANGRVALDLSTSIDDGLPWTYTLEARVTDITRQEIANRGSFVVNPAPWYIGVSKPPFFVDQRDGLDTRIVAARLDGLAQEGVRVDVAVKQIQWHSARQSEGNGFYSWDWERREIDAGEWTITSGSEPVDLHVPFSTGGFFELTATGTDAAGRKTKTKESFYVLGDGYTAWRRYDHNRIDLVPERKTWKPGETARVMIQSPWETATVLLTTEREGIRSHRTFDLTSTQQTVEIPITEADIPNLYVSVLLVKGRTKASEDADGSDPGKPAFRLGYVQLEVEDATKRLAVDVRANREEYRPANSAKIDVAVRDAAGRPARTEVTLWAVDYGVLSLTNYQTPDILKSVYVPKPLSVMNGDSRQRIVSRRAITPKGADEGGGGGSDASVSSVRKDFRVLAFWVGSIETSDKGTATVEVTLPESLTTYRIMAVAGDRDSRFGSGQSEIRINKPVQLRAAFPRFMALGDEAFFGAVVDNQLASRGDAVITMESLDPDVLAIASEATQKIRVDAKASSEVRWSVAARSLGTARVRMSVSLGGETDAFEDTIDVRILAPAETVAAYGQAKPSAGETVEIPEGVSPDSGGLTLDLSSTAMVGLGEGARYLVDYPYGCAEQKASSAIALILAADLGSAFTLPGIESAKIREVAQQTLTELEEFQCPNGGFAFWPGACASVSPYVTSYVLHVYHRGDRLGYTVSRQVLERAYDYLESEFAGTPEPNESWWPAYTAWQAFAVKVLVEGGRNQDSNITRLFGYLDRMPVFALSYLYDALAGSGERSGKRVDELRRRIFNSILPEGGSAHVEELSDPYLLWFWNSNVKSTSIALGSLVRNSNDQTHVASMVRWLMNARKKGRWGNTQENARAMEALVDFYRKYESEVPDFTAVVTLGSEELARVPFKGRSTESKGASVPMQSLLRKAPAGTRLPLSFEKDGPGTLYYIARLKYVSMTPVTTARDMGFRIERAYALEDSPDKPATSFKAGDLVRVTLKLSLTKERRWVAVTDPLPAGLEPVESWFSTTASALRRDDMYEDGEPRDWTTLWARGGFDYIERHDDRVNLFATRLSEGAHVFSYLARATTAGTFNVAPVHVEEMYEPEVFGRSTGVVVEVSR
jgi:alpha-2-macroglobulin